MALSPQEALLLKIIGAVLVAVLVLYRLTAPRRAGVKSSPPPSRALCAGFSRALR